MSTPIELGGTRRYLRFTSKSAQRATNDLQARMATSWIQQKLQIDTAANMIEKQWDRDAIVLFLSHGLEQTVGSEDKLWTLLDDHVKTHGTPVLIAKAIVDALIDAGVVREDPRDQRGEPTPERPTLTAVPSGPPGQNE